MVERPWIRAAEPHRQDGPPGRSGLIPRRGFPRRVVSGRELLAVGLYGATLSLVVAMTNMAVASGHMKDTEATSLMVAGVVSVLLLPLVAAKLLFRHGSDVAISPSDDRGGL